ATVPPYLTVTSPAFVAVGAAALDSRTSARATANQPIKGQTSDGSRETGWGQGNFRGGRRRVADGAGSDRQCTGAGNRSRCGRRGSCRRRRRRGTARAAAMDQALLARSE